MTQVTWGPRECPNRRRKSIGGDHRAPVRLLDSKPQPRPRADPPGLIPLPRRAEARTCSPDRISKYTKCAPGIQPALRNAAAEVPSPRLEGLSQPRKTLLPATHSGSARPAPPPAEVFTQHINYQTSAPIRGTHSLMCKHQAVNKPAGRVCLPNGRQVFVGRN